MQRLVHLSVEEGNKIPFPEIIEKHPRVPLAKHFLPSESSATDLVMVHHVNETGYEFIRALLSRYRIRKVVGIPYSAVPSVVKKLSREVEVEVVEMASIAGVVKKSIESSDSPVLIEEVGGYTAEIADFLDRSHWVKGVADVTMQGYWRWERQSLARLPVLSIAPSAIKATENTVVAKKVINGLAYFLQEHELGELSDKHVLVLGYGGIGTHAAKHLHKICKMVTVYDVDSIRYLAAGNDYRISRDWSDVDVVLGMTGSIEHALSADGMLQFRSGTIFVSGTSRDVEFDLKELRTRSDQVEEVGGCVTYSAAGKKLIVANNGRPIDFKYQAIPSRAVDPAFAGIVRCLECLDKGGALPGLHVLGGADQYAIANAYFEVYSNNF